MDIFGFIASVGSFVVGVYALLITALALATVAVNAAAFIIAGIALWLERRKLRKQRAEEES